MSLALTNRYADDNEAASFNDQHFSPKISAFPLYITGSMGSLLPLGPIWEESNGQH